MTKPRIVFFGNGIRGESCLKAMMNDKAAIVGVVLHSTVPSSLSAASEAFHLPVMAPEDPNDPVFSKSLADFQADLFVLAGYGKIFRGDILRLPKLMSLNLHGGLLPDYRGSSPMNWALINGERSFTLSVIKVDEGVDSGDVLVERTFPIDPNDTIVQLHEIANREFPPMLLEAISAVEKGALRPRRQDPSKARYFPLRFPDDGFVLWDTLTADELHNRVRALTEPYPCAFTFYKGRKVLLLSSELTAAPFYGTPGRIYRLTQKGALVCAKDRCLWVTKAKFADTGEDALTALPRYGQLATVTGAVVERILKDAHRQD